MQIEKIRKNDYGEGNKRNETVRSRESVVQLRNVSVAIGKTLIGYAQTPLVININLLNAIEKLC